MPLTNINISRTYHLGENNFFKLGNEGTIADNETREGLVEDAIGFFDRTVKKHFPDADISITTSIIEVKDKEPEICHTLEEQINSCKELKILESYKFIVKGKPEEKIYKAKLKELSK